MEYYEYENPISDVTVWLSEGLDKEPFLSVDGKLSKQGLKWSTIDLPDPYIVEAGKSLVIGYTIDVPANDDEIYALITDYSYDVNENSCQVYTNFTGFDNDGWPVFGGDYSWQDLGAEVGNIGLRAKLSGDMLPVDQVVTVDYMGAPYVSPGGDFLFQTMIKNLGANDITSVEYTMQVEGFPSAYLNRNMASSIYPAPEDLEEEMYWISGIPAYADVAAKLENTDDEKVIRLSVETEFGDSEDNASYMIG